MRCSDGRGSKHEHSHEKSTAAKFNLCLNESRAQRMQSVMEEKWFGTSDELRLLIYRIDTAVHCSVC